MTATEIEWADQVWNPTTGCDRVSPGCDHCYALTMARRLKAMGSRKYQTDGDPRTSGPGFGIAAHMRSLVEPFYWRKPRRIFVNSMSDIFHHGVSDEFIARVFAVMALTPRHTYQLLTKRHGRMQALLTSEMFRPAVDDVIDELTETAVDMRGVWSSTPVWPLPNVHLVVSVEDQHWADIRIPPLLETPAAVRGVSLEPLLSPVDLSKWLCQKPGIVGHTCTPTRHGLHWAIVGGESGPGARPMELAWAEGIVQQCQTAGVAVFMKQLGTVEGGKRHQDFSTFPASLQVRQYPAGAR